MENPTPRPDTINALRFGADASFAMLAGIQLDVFTPLQWGPLTTEQIADALGIAPPRLPLLLYALVAAGLLTEQDGRFSNTPEAQHFLVKDGSSYVGEMHRSLANQWGCKLKTAESLRTGIPQAHVDFSHASLEELEAFLRRISAATVKAAHELIERYDFSSMETVADVGGGSGAMAITLTAAHPSLRATVIDLPRVTPITRKIVDEAEAAAYVSVLTSDVVSKQVPGTYDTAVVRELLQVLSPEEAQRAVQHVGDAIKPGGMLCIVGQILDDTRTSPPTALGFNLIFINQFFAGQSYTEREHHRWLSEAGFVDIRREGILASGDGLMTARKRG